MRIAPLLAAALMLSACGADDNDPGVGGITVGEARALNEAAEMLDNQSDLSDVPADPDGGTPENATAGR